MVSGTDLIGHVGLSDRLYLAVWLAPYSGLIDSRQTGAPKLQTQTWTTYENDSQLLIANRELTSTTCSHTLIWYRAIFLNRPRVKKETRSHWVVGCPCSDAHCSIALSSCPSLCWINCLVDHYFFLVLHTQLISPPKRISPPLVMHLKTYFSTR